MFTFIGLMSFAAFEKIPPIRLLALRPRTLRGLGAARAATFFAREPRWAKAVASDVAARNGMSMGIRSEFAGAKDKRHRGGNGNTVKWGDWRGVNPCPFWVIDTHNVRAQSYTCSSSEVGSCLVLEPLIQKSVWDCDDADAAQGVYFGVLD